MLHHIVAGNEPNIRLFSGLHALFLWCDKPDIHLLHRCRKSSSRTLWGDPIFLSSDIHKEQSDYHKAFRFYIPTCSFWNRHLFRPCLQVLVSRLREAHDTDTSFHEDNHIKPKDIFLHLL